MSDTSTDGSVDIRRTFDINASVYIYNPSFLKWNMNRV